MRAFFDYRLSFLHLLLLLSYPFTAFSKNQALHSSKLDCPEATFRMKSVKIGLVILSDKS
jgi:hypothetical protein